MAITKAPDTPHRPTVGQRSPAVLHILLQLLQLRVAPHVMHSSMRCPPRVKSEALLAHAEPLQAAPGLAKWEGE